MLGPEIGDANVAVAAAVAPAQVSADSTLGSVGIGIIAVVQDHQLHIAEEDFNRIVIGTALR